MSYRVDIPTLSANEVYTLTFEYEGTETIQLIVGDLTLETTDRRVVFTTTSPVNYIESNVNLTNLNMYEGYYESDDFGGEYTQESYIEGKSLINTYDTNKHYEQQNAHGGSFGDYATKTITEDNMVNFKIDNADAINASGATWQKLFMKTGATIGSLDCFTLAFVIRKNNVRANGGITLHMGSNATKKNYDTNQVPTGTIGLYCAVLPNTTPNNIIEGTHYRDIGIIGFYGDAWQNGELEYGIILLEGDHYDDIISGVDYFTGIGCVKSPTIKSLSPENLYVSPLKYREPLRGYEYYHNDGTVEIYPNGSGAYSTIDLYTGEDIGLSYTSSQKTWYVNNGIKLGLGAGTYYFHCEIELVANKQITDFTGRPQVDVIYDEAQYFGIISSNFTETYDGEKYYYKGVYGASYKTVADDIRGIYVGIWSYGISGVEKYVIRNITLTKEASLKDVCAISKSSIITTPDDLELYTTVNPNATVYRDRGIADTLDLTTGIVTRNNKKFHFTVVEDRMRGDFYHVDLTTVGYWAASYSPVITNRNITQLAYNSALPQDGKVYFYIYQQLFAIGCSTWTSFNDAQAWLDEDDGMDVIIRSHENNIETEQISLNPLKSYRNGLITTSSQQLAPTLKTTLPISNKFTTTNLTSGSTYNVYFDGTATKLDAGGTIITNPISPCEVECGGTTLTIEGTDIQNVRVIETTVKNEVGSVNGTTDVELSKIIASDLEVITNDIEFSSASTDNGNINTVDNKLGTINTKGSHSWGAGYFTSNKTYPKGFSLLHIEFDVNMPSNNLMAIINFNNNVSNIYYNFRDLTLDNDTATIAQGQTSGTGVKYSSIVTKGHFSRLVYCFSSQGKINLNINTGSSAMLTASGNSAEGSTSGYTACANNGITISNFKIKVIENYPDATVSSQITSSLRADSGLTVIWQDMDMSIGQSISTLEQPIKLRSLGTTYDSYNPVTGELTKRIGVSETDGSYSVLSSPIVISSNYKILQDNNIILDSFPQEMNGAYIDFLPTQLLPNTTYTVFLDATTAVGQLECGLIYNGDWYDGIKTFTVGVQSFVYTTNNQIDKFGGFRIRGWGSIINNLIMVQGEYSLDYYNPIIPPQLYTNGQVKVYSDSEVYPTTILNGQSTNNYEINELNKSNSYTIRYEGECESINLNGKSNEQGTNRIVKTSTNGSGNLTFVNDNGDIDNVLLVQNDVREQEINHFTGLETVEVSRMLIENQRNMYCYKDISEPNGGYVTSVTPIPVQPSETLYCVVYNSLRYSSLVEYDLDMNLLRRTEINVGYGDNGNAVKLTENTYYIKVETGASFENKVMISRGGFLPLELCENIYQGQYIDLPQPVQLNGLPDGTCDTYNPITGEYVQNVGIAIMDENGTYGNNWSRTGTTYPVRGCTGFTTGDMASRNNTIANVLNNVQTAGYGTAKDYEVKLCGYGNSNTDYIPVIDCGNLLTGGKNNINGLKAYLKENPIILYYQLVTPITTQLTPIEIPTFEGGILQLITTDGKVFPMIEYSMPTNNRYDTSSWETGAVYTQRNMTEAYFNESTTPMIPTETMTLTTDHISSGSIIINDNGNGLIVLKGNYTGRDIPYFTGMRSVEAIEVETTPSPEQPLFGKGGRK